MKDLALKTLLKGVDLTIFSKNPPKDYVPTIKTRILLSSRIRRIYPKELADLEWHLNFLPFSDGSRILGKIDVCRQTADGAVFLRGWIFSPEFRIDALSVFINQEEYPILAFHIQRDDVYAHFSFLENSITCGFVATLEGCVIQTAQVNIGFAASGAGTVVRGSFEECCLETENGR